MGGSAVEPRYYLESGMKFHNMLSPNTGLQSSLPLFPSSLLLAGAQWGMTFRVLGMNRKGIPLKETKWFFLETFQFSFPAYRTSNSSLRCSGGLGRVAGENSARPTSSSRSTTCASCEAAGSIRASWGLGLEGTGENHMLGVQSKEKRRQSTQNRVTSVFRKRCLEFIALPLCISPSKPKYGAPENPGNIAAMLIPENAKAMTPNLIRVMHTRKGFRARAL